jgi:hypothetical protein
VRASSSIFCGKKIPSSIGKKIQPIRWIYELNLCLSIHKWFYFSCGCCDFFRGKFSVLGKLSTQI